jgi:Cupin-like domain
MGHPLVLVLASTLVLWMMKRMMSTRTRGLLLAAHHKKHTSSTSVLPRTTRHLRRSCPTQQRGCYHGSSLALVPPPRPIREHIVEDNNTREDAITEIMRLSLERQEPLVVRNLLSMSAINRVAMKEKFATWEFWMTAVDERTDCHVELGGNYASPNSQPADIPFMEFVAYMQHFEDRFGRSPSSTTTTGTTTSSNSSSNNNNNNHKDEPKDSDLIYLAQNDLFPEIYEHLEIPSFLETLGEQQDRYSTMLWIGPYGCVSPFHYDPLDNLLMQFVGIKQFLLCPPGSQLPPGKQSNTSSWDPYHNKEHENTLVPPEVATLNLLQQTLLHPGDAIYIPKKWYHHVKTMETSVSVNTWFR